MGPRTRAARALPNALAAAVLLAALAGCGDDESTSPNADPSTSTSQSPDEQPDDGPDTDPSADPDEGPVEVTPQTNLLDWSQVPGASTDVLVHAGDKWTMTVDDNGTSAVLEGDRTIRVPAGADRTIVDSFLTGSTAVVVAQDKAETRPQTVTLVDLETGKKSQLTDPPTGPGGPWAASEDTVAYATYQPGSDYCLATFDLASGTGEKGWCAPKRHGFSNLGVTPQGVSMMTFDNRRPVACRTLVDVEGTRTTPLEGPTECKGWEALATADGHVWSEIPKERQIEIGHFYASDGQSTYDLGEGSASTMVWCGDSAWFTRDAGKDGKARLLRWTPESELEIAYESPGKGEAFLSKPSCSGDVLSVAAYGEGGDEVVSATVTG